MKKIWEKILKENPHLERWDKSMRVLTLPGLDGVPLLDVYSFFVMEMKNNSMVIRARAIAFSFFLSIFPAILFIFSIIPYLLTSFYKPSDIDDYILKLIRDLSPSKDVFKFLSDFIGPLVKDLASNKRPSLLTSTFFLTIFLTSNGVMALMSSFDKSYDNYKKRNGIHARLIALKITFFLVGLFIFSLLLVVAGQDLLDWIFKLLSIKSKFTAFIFNFIRYVAVILVFFFAISLIYYYGPATKKKYRFISTGATVATVLSILASIGFSYYVSNFSKFNKLYGSIGTVMVMMIWLNVNAFVLLIGYEINAAIYYHHSLRQSKQEEEINS